MTEFNQRVALATQRRSRPPATTQREQRKGREPPLRLRRRDLAPHHGHDSRATTALRLR